MLLVGENFPPIIFLNGDFVPNFVSVRASQNMKIKTATKTVLRGISWSKCLRGYTYIFVFRILGVIHLGWTKWCP